MFSTLLFCEGHPLAIGLFGRDHLTIMQIVIISGGYLNAAQSEKNASVLQKYCKYGPPPLFFSALSSIAWQSLPQQQRNCACNIIKEKKTTTSRFFNFKLKLQHS